jgi:surface antigen
MRAEKTAHEFRRTEGRYRRANTPSVGSVIVMGGTSAGHVAVVTRVVGPRQIVIDHANWLGRGEIITGALVEDASANNDWSQVRVWNVQTSSMGLRPYPVFGFVGPETA